MSTWSEFLERKNPNLSLTVFGHLHLHLQNSPSKQRHILWVVCTFYVRVAQEIRVGLVGFGLCNNIPSNKQCHRSESHITRAKNLFHSANRMDVAGKGRLNKLWESLRTCFLSKVWESTDRPKIQQREVWKRSMLCMLFLGWSERNDIWIWTWADKKTTLISPILTNLLNI